MENFGLADCVSSDCGEASITWQARSPQSSPTACVLSLSLAIPCGALALLMRNRCVIRLLLLLLVCINSISFAQPTPSSPRSGGKAVQGEGLLLRGRYAEAREQFQQEADPAKQVLGEADCLVQTGKVAQAIQLLTKHCLGPDATAETHGSLAQLLVRAGRSKEALAHAATALNRDRKCASALCVQGDLSDADFYGQAAQLNSERVSLREALWIGRAKAEVARRKGQSRVFDELVNDFYPRLLERQPFFWPAHIEIGLVFLEKYNAPEALRSLNAALAINPRSADVHAALARFHLRAFNLDQVEKHVDLALQRDPLHLESLHAKCDLALLNRESQLAEKTLAAAAKVNAEDVRTLGRQWVLDCERLQGNVDEKNNSKSDQLRLNMLPQVLRLHRARFNVVVGQAYDMLRLYDVSPRYYSMALALQPNHVVALTRRGLAWMRLGEELKAREDLEAAFELDPFNVRVKNTLEVLDTLKSYALLETEHFLIFFDRGHDQLLAEYVSEYLETDVYPEITRQLGFKPEKKTLLEIYSRSSGTTGHGWFSARVGGTPFVGTIGACVGKMFALTSPADGFPYNWARVLRHEYVHIVNLEQTGFRIPHWFTEALAVRYGEVNYPAEWEPLLAKYVNANDLYNLSNINHGFSRPGSGDRWTLAYFQAYLYADYIVSLRGEAALKQMLGAYRKGADTEKVLQDVVGISRDEFEKGYRQFVDERVKAFLGSLKAGQRERNELEAAIEKNPKDVEALAELAKRHVLKKRFREARRLAEQALGVDDSHANANGVMAELFFAVGEDRKAWGYLNKGILAKDAPVDLIAMAADRKLADKDYLAAETYFEQGQLAHPKDPRWNRGLARVYLATGNDTKLIPVLAIIADRSPNKVSMAKKLAILTLKVGDYAAAEKWANRVIQVDVMDAMAHAQLAEAFAGQGKKTKAQREYKVALRLLPTESAWKKKLQELE